MPGAPLAAPLEYPERYKQIDLCVSLDYSEALNLFVVLDPLTNFAMGQKQKALAESQKLKVIYLVRKHPSILLPCLVFPHWQTFWLFSNGSAVHGQATPLKPLTGSVDTHFDFLTIQCFAG